MNELERQIINQAKGLPPMALTEILDFIKSVRHKKWKETKETSVLQSNEENYLKIMEKNQLNHLEDEFLNYRELYLYEK